jgi:hypothetical protein
MTQNVSLEKITIKQKIYEYKNEISKKIYDLSIKINKYAMVLLNMISNMISHLKSSLEIKFKEMKKKFLQLKDVDIKNPFKESKKDLKTFKESSSSSKIFEDNTNTKTEESIFDKIETSYYYEKRLNTKCPKIKRDRSLSMPPIVREGPLIDWNSINKQGWKTIKS